MTVATSSRPSSSSSSPRGAWQFAMTVIILPYFMGVMLSSRLLPDNFSLSRLFRTDPLRRLESSTTTTPSTTTSSSTDELVIHDTACDHRLLNFLKASASGHKDPFQGVSFIIHRNGEAEPCGNTHSASILYELRKAAQAMAHCPNTFDKYYVESLLSKVMHNVVSTCPSPEHDRDEKDGFLGFCDMGETKTPILLDHNQLVPLTVSSIGKKAKNITRLPCHFHTREGVRVTSLQQLSDLAQQATEAAPPSTVQCDGSPDQTCSDEDDPATTTASRQVHLYAVPAGRMFMFAPAFVGEIFELPHVSGADGLPVYLEVMSLSPRVFDVFNFFSKDESADLVTRALAETTESHRIKRSTTGAVGNQVNRKRTSESGFDTSGKTAMTVKRRCFKVLGFDTYTESHSDGLQILRYNLTTAYIPHMDWIDDPSGRLPHDYESGGRGGNRFATILLYMSDLGERDGGETVFVKAWPNGQDEKDRVQLPEALEQLRESGDAGVLEPGSWEEEMAAQCRTRLAIRPNSARAVLFYSQHPNGVADDASLHGGCPVLRGEKWAANLWVWNTPREGFFGAPRNPNAPKGDAASAASDVPTPQYEQITATFRNTGNDPAFAKAELYYDQETFWGKLGHDDPDLGANTYEGHRWDVKVDGKIVKTWVVEKGRDIVVFEV